MLRALCASAGSELFARPKRKTALRTLVHSHVRTYRDLQFWPFPYVKFVGHTMHRRGPEIELRGPLKLGCNAEGAIRAG